MLIHVALATVVLPCINIAFHHDKQCCIYHSLCSAPCNTTESCIVFQSSYANSRHFPFDNKFSVNLVFVQKYHLI